MTVGMSVTAVVQQAHADDVHEKPDEADNENLPGLVNDFDVNEALNGLDGDAKAEGDEEYCIDEGAEHFRASPSKRVFAPLFRRHLWEIYVNDISFQVQVHIKLTLTERNEISSAAMSPSM